MKAGWIGLGKLGLPCALALASFGGHEVTGYDISDIPAGILSGELAAHKEDLLPQLIVQAQRGEISFRLAASLSELAAGCDVIMIAVATPHDLSCDGTVPAPEEPSDFDYTALKTAVIHLAAEADAQGREITVGIVSTVLPGTMEREIMPVAGLNLMLAYCPSMISLGTTVANFANPGFHLAGTNSRRAAAALRQLFIFTGAPVITCDFPTAELAKMACNMQDTMKITYANFLGQLAQVAGANVNIVTDVLALHKSRWFPRAGMPDGGPCRPRDLIALDYLASQHNMSWNMAHALIRAREAHAAWLAAMAGATANLTGLPIVLAGVAYKPETNLHDGSPALLVRSFLEHDAYVWDVPMEPMQKEPAVFVVCARYEELRAVRYPAGSAVIDPWGITEMGQEGVNVIRVGR